MSGAGHAASCGSAAPTGAARDFEAIYRLAAEGGDPPPWDDRRPNPLLVAWLDRAARDVVRPGARIAVVGCGYGWDARALLSRGYDVLAFDLSRTAIDEARRLHADWADAFHVADLFALPSRWIRRFDLVVEIYTIQSMPPPTRAASMRAIESLLHPHGAMLVVCRASDHPLAFDEGPPWGFTVDELRATALEAGLDAPDGYELVVDEENPPKRRIRALLRHIE
jgi:SAM-dependent methyltransferase